MLTVHLPRVLFACVVVKQACKHPFVSIAAGTDHGGQRGVSQLQHDTEVCPADSAVQVMQPGLLLARGILTICSAAVCREIRRRFSSASCCCTSRSCSFKLACCSAPFALCSQHITHFRRVMGDGTEMCMQGGDYYSLRLLPQSKLDN